MSTSPFSVNRFEYEARHVYFVQTDAFAHLQARKPVYLIGPRGTGKTTLLQALNWDERRTNPSLRAQLTDHTESFIGVYIKIPEIDLGSIEKWMTTCSEIEAGQVVAFYLDLLWVHQSCEAISRLVLGGELAVSAEAEQTAVRAIVEEFPRTFSSLSGRPKTLLDLKAATAALARELVQSARSAIHPSEYWGGHDAIQQPGTFGRRVGSQLTGMLRGGGSEGADGWYFKVCLDEGECLSALQQRALNSMVRLSRWPVFFVAAFVRMPKDVIGTLIPGLTLQNADCELVDLTEFLNRARFKELAQGVATARVRHRLNSEDAVVQVDTIFGTYGINDLLERILGASVSPRAKALLEAAALLREEPFVASESGMPEDDSELSDDGAPSEAEEESTRSDAARDSGHVALPIYQAYLIDKLRIEIPRPNEATWLRRRQSSAQLRKRMVAAYLSICTDLNTDVRYASSTMLMELCDLCIRDFLDFLEGVHLATGVGVREFVERQVAIELQSEALVAVSEAKSAATRARGVRSPREAESVVRGLARVTQLLQSQSENGEHLRSSERGKFVLPTDRFDAPNDPTAQVIRDACEAGFLRMIKSASDFVTFRVHTSLAPAFKFSYRGAYYDAPVSWADIDLLRRSESEADVEIVAKRIATRLAGEQNLSLFGGV